MVINFKNSSGLLNSYENPTDPLDLDSPPWYTFLELQSIEKQKKAV